MSICRYCKKEIYTPDQDLYNELVVASDYWGEASLTENQQLLVRKIICEDCYDKLDEF